MVVMKIFVELHFRENQSRKYRKIAQFPKQSTILAATFAKILAETAAKILADVSVKIRK
jgi:hypothetical protein